MGSDLKRVERAFAGSQLFEYYNIKKILLQASVRLRGFEWLFHGYHSRNYEVLCCHKYFINRHFVGTIRVVQTKP